MTPLNIYPSVTVCNHPLLHHQLSIVRDKHSHHEVFRLAVQRVSQFVLQEATRHLPLAKTSIETPLTKIECSILSPDVPIIAVPILRAGLVMSQVMMDLIPTISVYYLGLYRDKETLKPVTYYNKLPQKQDIDYSQARVFILDPMLATGGSIGAALEVLCQLGVKESNVTVACIIAAPEGVKALMSNYTKIKIVTGAMDECLNENAYIIPGLGDAGDRAFGTLHV